MRRGSARRTMVAIGVAAAIGLGGSARAPAEDALSWTLRPTRIDRDAEIRERLPDRTEDGEGGPIGEAVVADVFPRVGPDASFAAGGRRLRIAHVELPEFAARCRTPNGEVWACGLRARVAFSNLVAGRRLTCRSESTDDDPAAPVDCVAAGRSIAETLVALGWATPGPDAPEAIRAAHRRALASKRGLASVAVPP